MIRNCKLLFTYTHVEAGDYEFKDKETLPSSLIWLEAGIVEKTKAVSE